MAKLVRTEYEQIEVRQISVRDTISLRHSVLWPDKPISHVQLPEDDRGLHIGAFLGDVATPVAVLSLFKEPLPETGPEDAASQAVAVRFRKFACDPRYQGRGIGTMLLESAFKTAHAELGAKVAWCDARSSTAQWYRNRGMAIFGESFLKGSVEYVRMRIDL